MNIDNETKRFVVRLKWLGLYFGIGLILLILLPFPYDFTAMGLFVLVNFMRGRSLIKRFGGIDGIKDIFSSTSGNDQQRPLKYYCMSCGKEHRGVACPNCGSKMKKVG